MKNPKAREKLSQAHNALKRPLVQISLLDNSIVNWDSKNKAGKTLNLSIAGIYTALNSESHFAYDSLWFYEEDYKHLETSSYSLNSDVYHNDLDMNVIRIWNSITDIHNELGYDRGTIINNCKGRTATSHNFIWKYFKEESVA